jgi:hypothetical protein
MRLAALGWLENCLPFFVSSRFFLLLAAYWLALIALIAAEGRYRSPVALEPCVDGLPDLVRHFCLVHALNDF